jgi:hypothetical protein
MTRVTEARNALASIDCVADVRTWHRSVRGIDGHVNAGEAVRFCVEAEDVDDTTPLNDAMKSHGLVITEVRCGADGWVADLRFIDRVAELYDK